jgi:asparagine synthase (glutamine-hydrolysing)
MSPASALQSWVTPIPDSWRAELLPAAVAHGSDVYETTFERSNGAKLLPRLLDLNLRTYLLDDLLPKVDRMAMAHALEVRSPFLDTELVEFALRLPPEQLVRGFSRKRVLKSAVRDLLPPSILRRRKRGFGVPLDRWFRTELATFVSGRLGGSEARVKAHLVPSAVDAIVAEHLSGARNHGQALWTLLTLELFLRREGW